MKTPLCFPSFRSLPALAAGALLASAPLLSAQTWYWKGPDGTGNSGDWDVAANWSDNAVPGTGQSLRFDHSATYSSKAATITIREGVHAEAGALAIRLGKEMTFVLENGASFIASGNLNIGAGATSGVNSATIEGPETGSAIAKFNRIYITGETGGRKTVELTGKGLDAEQTGSYADLAAGASLILSGGAKLTATKKDDATQAGDFHIRAVSDNGINNRLILEEGTLAANLISVYGGAALVQLSKNSVLKSSGTEPLTVNINTNKEVNGARFEVEGSGLDATVSTRVLENGILAIGLSDPDTGARMEAGKLTLGSAVRLESGSILEINIFGSGDAGIDQIDFSTTAETELNIRSGALLDLKLNGYTPTEGESWTLFTGDTGNITGNFNLDLIDTNLWDLSNFNETGGWVIVSQIPEPSGVALLLVSGTGMLALLRRNLRRRQG